MKFKSMVYMMFIKEEKKFITSDNELIIVDKPYSRKNTYINFRIYKLVLKIHHLVVKYKYVIFFIKNNLCLIRL